MIDVKTHSREILPTVAALLDEKSITLGDLDGIVFGQGPGSFTGLRIAVGVVQGLAYGAGIPVVPVSSLAVLAQGRAIAGDERVFVAIKARLEEVYYGAYRLEGGFAEPAIEEGVCDVSELQPLQGKDWHIMTDVETLVPKMESSLQVSFANMTSNVTPGISELLELGANAFERGLAVSALEATPVYLREQVVFK